jgi:TATA-binding protein-associated factor Taf7
VIKKKKKKKNPKLFTFCFSASLFTIRDKKENRRNPPKKVNPILRQRFLENFLLFSKKTEKKNK